ncbi:MAG: FAD-dependent oxidoreductase [Thermoproteota archaeon]
MGQGHVQVPQGSRPDIAVLQALKGFSGLERGLRFRRPRWPYCSRPWCPGNRAYLEDRNLYVPATQPLHGTSRVKVYGYGLLQRVLSLIPSAVSPGALHGKLRGKLHGIVTRLAYTAAGWEPPPAEYRSYGALPIAVAPPSVLRDVVVVVGSGVSGLAAALEAARFGARVIVAEAESALGGFARWLRGTDLSHTLGELLSKLSSEHSVTVMGNTSYIGLFDEGHALLGRDGVTLVGRGSPIIYAGGSEAPPFLAEGNDLPGVVSLSYALELVVEHGYRPHKVALVGTGPWASEAAKILARELGRERKIYIVGSGASLDKSELPPDAELVEAGSVRVQGAGRASLLVAGARRLEVDMVVSAPAEYPDANPAYAAGYRAAYCSEGSFFHPEPVPVSRGELEKRSLLIPVGAAAGEFQLEGVVASAKLGGTIAAWLRGLASEEDVKAAYSEYERASRALRCRGSGGPKPPVIMAERPSRRIFVDFDEDVTVADVLEAWDRGYRRMELIKRATGLGTGPEQGRFSAALAAVALGFYRGADPSEVGIFRSRPPHVMPAAGLLAIADFGSR